MKFPKIKKIPEKLKQFSDSKFIGKNKFRFGRGQGYVGAINTTLLLVIAFRMTDWILIMLAGVSTFFLVWLIGFIDDKKKVVHAEQGYSVEQANPYFKEMKEEIRQIRFQLQRQSVLQRDIKD